MIRSGGRRRPDWDDEQCESCVRAVAVGFVFSFHG
jgi:hypothetical protein